MRRELRMVPANYKHPQYLHEYSGEMRNQPMYDRRYISALDEWIDEYRSNVKCALCDTSCPQYIEVMRWLEQNPMPDYTMYRTWNDADATWFQIWETVSEGTPVTPPFATKEELFEYLTTNGDFWSQARAARNPNEPRAYTHVAANALIYGIGHTCSWDSESQDFDLSSLVDEGTLHRLRFTISQQHTVPIPGSACDSYFTIALYGKHVDGHYDSCDEYGNNHRSIGPFRLAFFDQESRDAWKGMVAIANGVEFAILM